MNFWHLVNVVNARKWIIIGLIAATLIVVAIAAPNPQVTYEASCLMQPTPQAMNGGVEAAAKRNPTTERVADRNVILSNILLLAESSDVFQRASDFLAMSETQQKRLMPGLPSYRHVPRLMYAPGKALQASAWSDVLKVEAVVNPGIGEQGTISDVIRIKVKLQNGEDAPYIANAVGVAFIQAYDNKSHEDSKKYMGFLDTGKNEALDKLQRIETEIAEYKRSHRIVAADAETQNAVSNLATLESNRDAAQSADSEARATLWDIDRQLAKQPLVLTQSLPVEMNPKVTKLKEELAQAESDLRTLALRYKPEHSDYKAAEAKIKVLQDKIAAEGKAYSNPAINDVHQQLVKDRSAAMNRVASTHAKLAALDAQVAEAQGVVSGLAGAEKGMLELTREHQQASDEYSLFSQNLASARIADRAVEKTGSIIPVDWAITAVGPVVDGPRKRTLLIYGFVLSLVMGVAFSIWLDSIDNRIKNGKHVEELLGLPAVGLIPSLEGGRDQLPKLTHIYPLSAAAESYRLLRTHVLFAHRDNPFKTLMVASSKPGQGATTTICNLGIALAQIGKKVVLIDADMRRPSLHDFFGVSNETGLSTLLQGSGEAMDAIKQTEIENLIVVPAGPPPLNPSELLASDRMWEVVRRFRDNCDFVLFDTPSTVVFSDGPVLASWLDAVLFVVSANQVPRGTEKQALEMLRKAKANILGTVVNRLNADTVDSCHFHSRYYASSMGDVQALPGDNGSGGGATAKPLKNTQARRIAELGTSEKPASAPAKESSADNPFPD